MAGLPRLDADLERLVPIPGAPPNLADPPSGCRFHPRCAVRNGRAVCVNDSPALLEIAPDHRSACHFAGETVAELERVSELTGVALAADGSAGDGSTGDL